jgi:hypothetical protein
MFDALPNSLKDSNSNLKMKTMEEGVKVRFLARNIPRIRRACWSSEMEIKMNDK